MSPEEVPDLRRKIDIVRTTFNIPSDGAFAQDVLGVSSPTLSDYLSGRGTGRSSMPRARFERFCRYLEAKLPNRLTAAQAALALKLDSDGFQRAISTRSGSSLDQLIARTPSTFEIEIVLRPPRDSGLSLLDDEDPEPLDPATQFLFSDARIEFRLSGRRGRHVFILAETPTGWHIAAPRSARPVHIDAQGRFAGPKSGLRFPRDGGLFVFYAFLIEAKAPPALIALAGRRAPLFSHELDAFAADLDNSNVTKGFALSRLSVFVRAREE